MRKMLVVVAMIAGITLLIWAGVHNARERRMTMQTQISKSAAGSAAARAGGDTSDTLTPKMTGKVAPAFTLVDLDGKKVSLADYKGKPVFLNFWATWCGPCKLEMPWLEEFSKKYASEGLVFLGISTDDIPKATIAATAHKLGVTYTILLKDDKVENDYGGIDMMPQSFYIDRTGKVMLETAGISDGQGGKDEIEANIRKLLASGAK